MSKSIEIKTSSKYLIGYQLRLSKVIRLLVLKLPKKSVYLKTFEAKDKKQ